MELAALGALEAIAAAAREMGAIVAIAVVDPHGDLIAARRMDGARPRWMSASLRKAYTAAVMDRDTAAFHEDMLRRHLDLAHYGDVRLTGLPGGVVVRDESGETVAGIGVTGNTGGRDAALAELARACFASATTS